MSGFRFVKTASGIEPFIWMSLSGLLLLGTLSTVIDLLHLPTQQMLLANGSGQRAVIDTQTGVVSLTLPTAKDVQAFDVGDETKPTVETPKPEEAPPAGETRPDSTVPVEVKSPEGLVRLRTEPTATALPEVAPSKDTLVPAPAPEVSEKKDNALLPKRNGEASPATIYARKFVRTKDQHLLSVVVLDAGLSAQSLPLILGLPKETTVAFSPYAEDAQGRIGTLRKAGYETWGMLPAMGVHYPQDDPGPLGLVANLPPDEMLRRLRVILATTLGSVGVVLPPDEALSAKAASFSPVLAEIDARGLSILTTGAARTPGQVTGPQKMQSTVHRADMVLDPIPDEDAIRKKLGDIEAALKTKDTVVVVTSARPQTLLLLQQWFHDHPLAEPAVLAPLSAQWLPKEAPAPVEEEKKPEGGHGDAKKDETAAEKKPEPEKKSGH